MSRKGARENHTDLDKRQAHTQTHTQEEPPDGAGLHTQSQADDRSSSNEDQIANDCPLRNVSSVATLTPTPRHVVRRGDEGIMGGREIVETRLAGTTRARKP